MNIANDVYILRIVVITEDKITANKWPIFDK